MDSSLDGVTYPWGPKSQGKCSSNLGAALSGALDRPKDVYCFISLNLFPAFRCSLARFSWSAFSALI